MLGMFRFTFFFYVFIFKFYPLAWKFITFDKNPVGVQYERKIKKKFSQSWNVFGINSVPESGL
jgi:hypothetical protein